MSRQASYGGYLERLVTAGGERALAIEVPQSVAQRPVFVSASVHSDATIPTKPEQNGFARLLVYVGSLADTTSILLDSSRVQLVQSLGLVRLIATQLVRVGESVQIELGTLQADQMQCQANETIGAAILIPSSVDPDGIAPSASFNAVVALTFFAAPIQSEQPKQYKVI